MSFHLRSLSARRYRVEGDLPSLHETTFSRRLLDRAFRPLADLEEKAFGWVTIDNCLDTHFEAGNVARGPCAAFALRIDRRRVNGRLLRARLDLEMRGRRKDAALQPAGGKRKRDEKQELRRALTEELMRTTNPTVEVHPVLLYPKRKVLLFLSTSKTANETFRALFSDTFDATLCAMTPYQRGVELLADRGGAEALSPLRRTEFGRDGEPSRSVSERRLPAPSLLRDDDVSAEDLR